MSVQSERRLLPHESYRPHKLMVQRCQNPACTSSTLAALANARQLAHHPDGLLFVTVRLRPENARKAGPTALGSGRRH